jgi:hypothetical protein
MRRATLAFLAPAFLLLVLLFLLAYQRQDLFWGEREE